MAAPTSGRAKADTAVDTAILRETIRKEEKHTHLRDNFRVTDPMKMADAVLPVPPHKAQVQAHISDEEHAATQASLDELSNRQRVALLPPEKYELPMSSSQEYGFHMNKPLVPPSTLTHMDASRKTCEETRYASHYYALSGGLTPFSKKERGTPGGSGGDGAGKK